MKDTKSMLVNYQDTDLMCDLLLKIGCKVICISYGYTNSQDLIIFEEV